MKSGYYIIFFIEYSYVYQGLESKVGIIVYKGWRK